ncbi:MAG: glycosyltransferase [Actinomycetota bacterium]
MLLNPDLPLPAGIEALVNAGRVRFSNEVDPEACRIYHVIAPFELELGLDRVWPARLAGASLVVTLHDLIPRVYPGHYHADLGLRRRYLAREELVRAADRVLSVSETTRREAVERLGIAPGRIRVIGAGISPAFAKSPPGISALQVAQRAVPGLEPGFLLYVGGEDHRKNLDGLLAAYARLALELRRGHQLVVACRLSGSARRQLLDRARALGVGDRMLLTGVVDDPTLVALYQATELFVFPSRYEGYGLPVAEEMACGAPVVAANTSATAELAPIAGQFDPDDPNDLARAITAGLTDPSTRQALLEGTEAPPPTWEQAAARAAAVYEELLVRPPARRRTVRVGVVTPLPPQRTGVAVYTARLLEALGRRADGSRGPRVELDVFIDALEGGTAAVAPRPAAPFGTTLYPIEQRAAVAAARGGYDVMVYAIGNSEFHTGALAAARAEPGIVLAHDLSLGQLYAFAAHHGVIDASGPGSFAGLARRWYPEQAEAIARLPDPLLVDPTLFVNAGIAMARELMACSLAFLTTSAHAAELARGEAPDGAAGRIGVLVHACRALPPRDPAGVDEATVVSFGVVNAAKDLDTLIAAAALLSLTHPDARLVLVGQASPADRATAETKAKAAGIAGKVTVTGAVSDAGWDGWLARATVAVQLRRASTGEFSGAVAEAVAAGVPTIVAGLGSASSLPEGTVVNLPANPKPGAVAKAIGALLNDPERRSALSASAQQFAAGWSFPAVAGELYQKILALSGWAEAREPS